jgi:predicted secreted protein
MNWFTGVLVYVMIWWVVLFTVLPWGVRVPDEHAPGHATSAPAKPMILRKALITTAIAGVLWGIAYLLIDSGLVSFRPR